MGLDWTRLHAALNDLPAALAGELAEGSAAHGEGAMSADSAKASRAGGASNRRDTVVVPPRDSAGQRH